MNKLVGLSGLFYLFVAGCSTPQPQMENAYNTQRARPRYNTPTQVQMQHTINDSEKTTAQSEQKSRSQPAVVPKERAEPEFDLAKLKFMPEDRIEVTNKLRNAESVARLKVAIVAKKGGNEENVSDRVCDKIKERIAASQYFEAVSRDQDDLTGLDNEKNLSGSREGTAPLSSDILVNVAAEITSYLAGSDSIDLDDADDDLGPLPKFSPSAHDQAYRQALMARNDMAGIMAHDAKVRARLKKEKEKEMKKRDEIKRKRALARAKKREEEQNRKVDRSSARGVKIRATCKAYGTEDNRSLAEKTINTDAVGESMGQVDEQIDIASEKIAVAFLSSLEDHVDDVFQIDCPVVETREKCKVAKIDIANLNVKKPREGDNVSYYIYDEKKGGKRKKIAKGVVRLVDEDDVWATIVEIGYGNVHIGHCAAFEAKR